MPVVALEIEFPLHAVGRLGGITSAVLRQAEFAHEMLIVDCTQDIQDLRSNTPVQATLGSVGQSISYVGYVHHVRDQMGKHGGERKQRIVCIGPTWRMRQPRQRVWENLTASEIVLRILGEYQMTGDVQPTALRLHHKVQGGESDWAFICRLARESGMVVVARNTVVTFRERKHAEDQSAASARVFSYASANVGYADTEVTEFNPILGEDMPHAEGAKAARLVQGVDPRTAKLITASHDGRPNTTRRTDNVEPLFTYAHTDVVANSVDTAIQKASGKSGIAMWQHRAEAETVGDVTVAPAEYVFMANVPSHYEGFWSVIEVQHIFRIGQYRLRMQLGTDALGQNVGGFVPPEVPLAHNGRATSRRNKPTTSSLATPGNYTVLDQKRSGGGPAPVAWRGSAAVTSKQQVVETKGSSAATLVARARRFKNSGR